jgi:hypothetical protein
MNIIAVVLNWRGATDTISCVMSLRAFAPQVHPIVVDNASGDGSLERIAEAVPYADIVRNESNLGYAGGNNAGIRRALAMGAEAVLILNNDIVLRRGCVDALEQALQRHPSWGIVGPISLRAAAPEIVDFFTATVDVGYAALSAPGRDELRNGRFTADAESDYVTGSAMLVRRAVLQATDGFDERFFLMWEDVDLALRARKAGWRCGATPEAVVLHGRSGSFGGDGAPLQRYFFVRNPYLLVRKHLSGPARWRAIARISRRYRTWARDPMSGRAVGDAIALGARHGLRGRFGPPPAELLRPLLTTR